MIRVINRRLGAGLDPDLFSHRAVYDAARERIEMWLHSEELQSVSIPHLEARFRRGEGVHTEINTQFTPDSASRTFEEARLELLDLYTDDANLFALALGRAA